MPNNIEVWEGVKVFHTENLLFLNDDYYFKICHHLHNRSLPIP